MPDSFNPVRVEQASAHEIHRAFWLYMPLGFFAVRYSAYLLSDSLPAIEKAFKHELGIVENLTVVLLVVALFYTASILLRFGRSLHPLFNVFLLLYSMGCIYFAGEEASWGQHWFGWESGEYFKQANDQEETNLHNISPWLDRHPKGIISFLIFVGGVIVPLVFYFKNKSIDYRQRWWWLWPTRVCLPAAVFATIATWPSKIENTFGIQFYFDQAQETKECYIASFLLLYIVSLAHRLRHLHHNQEEFSPL